MDSSSRYISRKKIFDPEAKVIHIVYPVTGFGEAIILFRDAC